MYDFTKNICGESAKIECLVPNGSDFREWTPTAEDIEKAKSADMFVYSGKGAEPWIDQVLAPLRENSVTIVNASANISEDSQSGFVWLNPRNALVQMTEIYNAVKAADPQNEVVYTMNMNIFEEKIVKLDNMYKSEISTLPDKNIYVTALIFDNLCNAYGLTQAAISGIGYQGGVDALQKDAIRQTLVTDNVKCIYTEPQNDTYMLRELVSTTQTSVGALDPFIVNLDNGGYFNTMEDNLLSLTRGQMPALTS